MFTFAPALQMEYAPHRFHSDDPQLASSNLQSAVELRQTNVLAQSSDKTVFAMTKITNKLWPKYKKTFEYCCASEAVTNLATALRETERSRQNE